MNLPTKITVSRIVSIVVMIVTLVVLSFIKEFHSPILGLSRINLVYLILCVFFLVASFTDYLDGHLARKNNQVTNLGKFLDPVADKLLINSLIIFLVTKPHYVGTDQVTVTVWTAIILVARDIVVDSLRFIAAQKNVVIAANIFGKLKTVLEMVFISVVLLNGFPFTFIDGDWNIYFVRVAEIATVAASVLSGAIYVVQNRKVFLGD